MRASTETAPAMLHHDSNYFDGYIQPQCPKSYVIRIHWTFLTVLLLKGGEICLVPLFLFSKWDLFLDLIEQLS